MQITACPICGSKRISVGNLSDGIIAGLSSWKEVCQDCGYQGASLLFETEEDYQRYLTALQNNDTEHKKDGIDEDTTEEPPTQALFPQKKNYSFEFVLSLIFSIIFLVVLVSGSYLGINDVIFTNDFFTTVLYFIGIFISVLIFFFLSVVFIETVYRSIRGNREKK